MTYEKLSQLAQECGFNNWAPLKMDTIQLKAEVRQMCANNTCGQYGKKWSCPPGCGSLMECSERLSSYTHGILVQTVGGIENSFDFEAMSIIETGHKACFEKMLQAIQLRTSAVLALGTGCCTNCASCTYPDKPCRFPKKMVSSMEAYGMIVLEICKANGLQYYYGPDKMAYTGCFLVN